VGSSPIVSTSPNGAKASPVAVPDRCDQPTKPGCPATGIAWESRGHAAWPCEGTDQARENEAMAITSGGGVATRALSTVPRRRTSFLGRQEDLEGIGARLEVAPAVTLVGVGGVGKTSLAYEVAARIERESGTTVHVVELAATVESAGVARVVADVLDLPVAVEQSPSDAVAGYLRTAGPTLLVLDNCEQVIDGAAALVDLLLDRCPQLTVLATSRTPLGVEGEAVWPVEPLSVSDEAGGSGPAVRLLIERAEATHPRALEGTDREQIIALATRLDGVPLAIELAASRLGAMDLSELSEQLDQHLLQLESSRRTVVERHRSLAGVVDWSFRLLDDDEKTLALGLSVFRGSFTRDAARAVLGLHDFAPLERLAEVSLLTVTDRGGGSRFLMLEMIREFLAEGLEESGAAETVRRAHAEWAAGFVTRLRPELRGPSEAAARRKLRSELANVGAALEWSADVGETELLVRLVRGLHDEVLAGGGREVHAWLERAVEAAWDHPEAVDVLATGATGALVRGDIVRYRQVLERWDELGTEGTDVVISRRLEWASLLVFEGRVDEGVEVAAALEGELPEDGWRASHVLMRRAQPYAYAGQSDAAVALTERSLEAAEQTGNPTALGWARYVHGEALMEVDSARAIESYESALRLAHSVDNLFLVGLLSVALASALGRHGDPEQALAQFQDTIRRWRDVGGWSFLSTTLRNFGEFLTRIDRFEEAVLIRCAVENIEASSGAGGTDADRDRHLRRTLVARLGSEQFEQLRHDSKSLGRDGVVELALRIVSEELQARAGSGEFRAIVFTDLERSTQFTADAGDAAARTAMRDYEGRTDAALARCGGDRIKGTGDGVLASFTSVSDALRCVTSLARDVDTAVARGELPLRLRVGVHAGEVIMDEGDVHGTVVNLAARVVDRAAGGEVLVTETVRQIAAGSGYDFVGLGEATLKGIPEPIKLYRIDW
jgi:predicted ATPase/class 3 adenylate cyclase